MESEERLWLLLQLQAHRHGWQQGGWGKAAASQKVTMGAGLYSLSLSVRASSPDSRLVFPLPALDPAFFSPFLGFPT